MYACILSNRPNRRRCRRAVRLDIIGSKAFRTSSSLRSSNFKDPVISVHDGDAILMAQKLAAPV